MTASDFPRRSRIYRASFLFLLLFSPIFSTCAEEGDPYGGVTAENYITGRFQPVSHPLFVNIQSLQIPTNGRAQYLRREAADALSSMYAALKKSHQEIRLYVTSSTRTFYDQKAIWENKWNGRTLIEGQNISRTIHDPLRRALKILEYSSMPGTSRHHWGTDFDLNELYDQYYTSGAGTALYRWLLENAPGFGFCQPYSAGRNSGYYEEKWHWSYRPLSSRFLADWVRLNTNAHFLEQKGLFDGSDLAGKMAQTYVTSVNPDCR